ncbi:MAG: late competence development ComFB family protein [Oceanospirillaceae bacterium]|nr:late competence development ComFB family protein [Oceanospirillaceae bacterium]MCP5350963.1 late competence development ComFB family protein [Oceanospirillaceae bacterium]
MSVTDKIQNYYEAKVADELQRVAKPMGFNEEQLADLACLALNHLPPRYFRHEVDIAFYMSVHELEDIRQRVEAAVKNAIDYISKHSPQS